MNIYNDKNIIVNSKSPLDSIKIYDDGDLNTIKTNIESIDLNEFSTSVALEVHIYSENNRLFSFDKQISYGNTVEESQNKYTYDIKLTPENDVRNSTIDKGYYSVLYNFIDNFTSNLKIKNISADRTEVELTVLNNISKSELKRLYNSTITNSDEKPQFVLNFGENQLEQITNISFRNNELIGSVTTTVDFPKDTFESDDTIFYPISEDYWIEINRDTTSGLEYTTTGRAANFNITIGTDNLPSWKQDEDDNGNPIYLAFNSPDLDRESNVTPGSDYTSTVASHATSSRVRFFNNRIKDENNITNVVVKLYRPLTAGIDTQTPKIDKMIRSPYVERVIVFPRPTEDNTNNFSDPNFKIDTGVYGKSQGTDFKSWNDLLDANLSTAQQIIDVHMSSSFGETDVNIDYSDFQNFVHYSSAIERVKNFRYKVELIEGYDTRIATLSSISGSETLSNISQSITRKNNVISGFDGFEKWMYYQPSGSLYTHYSSSVYTIEPWPKKTQYPVKLAHTSASFVEGYYQGLISSASVFDAFNDARLTKTIPTALVEDPLNSDYLLFIDMIGHHFDITWSYIKKLTSVNSREEHPYDGVPNELLYDVAKSMGWKLTHGKDRSDLWNYTLGTDRLGNPIQSGSLASKPYRQVNWEVWRRIVNNIPYLLKNKGTARAVKALIATYGIPQTFLSIREYGGPVVDNIRHIWEHDRFVYHLRFDTDNYIEVPWDKINDINSDTYLLRDITTPDTIELQVQQNLKRTTGVLNKDSDFAVIFEPTGSTSNRGNIHLYLNGAAGYKSASINDVSIFDSTMSTLIVQRETSIDDITADNTYKIHYQKNRKDRISTDKSASITIDGSTESSYNAAWTGSGTLTVGKSLPSVSTPSLWASTDYLSGSIQELRYWGNPLNNKVIDEHTLSRESYHGNSATSSYFDLKFRLIPDSRLNSVAATYGFPSQHPNQQITTTQNGSIISASLFNFEADDLRGVAEEYYTKIPSAGANNIMNNKVRIEGNSLTGMLDVDQKKEKSRFDTSPVDSNQVGVYLSATKMFNEDVYNHTGFFEIDDYIGNPDNRSGFTEGNGELDQLRRDVFKKYSNKNLINSVIDILSRYDFSVFEQIRQTMPARADYNSGILIEPHILERPKVKAKTNISYTNPQYETLVTSTIIDSMSANYTSYESLISESYLTVGSDYILHESTINVSPITPLSSYVSYETTVTVPRYISASREDIISVGNPIIKDQYVKSRYQYETLIRTASAYIGDNGAGWTSSSNAEYIYNPIGTNILNARPSQYAKSTVYFYSSAYSASFNASYSSSLVTARVATDNLPLAIQNLRYLGCKMTSDSLTTNSPNTPDGRPVIEIFQADPNVLVYTSETAENGNLDIDVETNLPILKLEDLIINDCIQYQRKLEYNKEVKKFRKMIQKLKDVETQRRKLFDENFKMFQKQQLIEQDRRDEFDIKNIKS